MSEHEREQQAPSQRSLRQRLRRPAGWTAAGLSVGSAFVALLASEHGPAIVGAVAHLTAAGWPAVVCVVALVVGAVIVRHLHALHGMITDQAETIRALHLTNLQLHHTNELQARGFLGGLQELGSTVQHLAQTVRQIQDGQLRIEAALEGLEARIPTQRAPAPKPEPPQETLCMVCHRPANLCVCGHVGEGPELNDAGREALRSSTVELRELRPGG